jgi:hypothetical protein
VSLNRIVSVLLARGDGTFAERRPFEIGAGPRDLAIADLNGDAVLDIAAAFSGGVAILLGAGDGSFFPAEALATVGHVAALAAGAVNDDEIVDIVAANYDSNALAVLLGRGDGTFAEAKFFATGSQPQDVGLADVDRDGLLDAVTANFDADEVALLIGRGDGTFAPPASVRVGDGPRTVAVADLNRDGRPDIVTANSLSHDVSVLLAAGLPICAGDCDGNGAVIRPLQRGRGIHQPERFARAGVVSARVDMRGLQLSCLSAGGVGLGRLRLRVMIVGTLCVVTGCSDGRSGSSSALSQAPPTSTAVHTRAPTVEPRRTSTTGPSSLTATPPRTSTSTPTNTPSPAPTSTPPATPTATATASATVAPSPTATHTDSPTPTATPSATPIPGTTFTALLTGDEEVPPVQGSESGEATFVLSADETALAFELNVFGHVAAAIQQAYIHVGPRGFNGPAVLPLTQRPLQSPWRGTLTAANLIPNANVGVNTFADFVAALKAGDAYVNAVAAIPLMRGQIRVPTSFVARLSGIPSATGRAAFVLSADERTLAFRLSVASHDPAQFTEASIHVAPPGVGGPVVFSLADQPFGDVSGELSTADLIPAPDAGIETFADFVAAREAGNAYILVQRPTNPPEALRGSIQAPLRFAAVLSGEEEAPPVNSPDDGRALLVVNSERSGLRLAFEARVAVSRCPNMRVRVHVAPRGMNGPIVFNLQGDPVRGLLRWQLSPADLIATPEAGIATLGDFIAALEAGDVYVNMISGLNPDGEIRGQLEATARVP